MNSKQTAGVIRLATFNINSGIPNNCDEYNPYRVADACRQLRADVLALQEVDQSTWRSKRAKLANLAAKESGMEVIFAETRRYNGGYFGNALLVRGDITDYRTLPLKGARRHELDQFQLGHKPPRNAILATAHVAAGEVSVAATHLSIEHAASRRQLCEVMAALACLQTPRVLMGDLNLRRQQLLSHPALSGMELASGPLTYPVDNPTLRIDHIAVQGLTVQRVKAIPFEISDHRALVVDASFE